MKKLVVIGQGPAGISAALYAVRGGADVTVIAKDGGALAKAELIQNYYGFENGIPAALLIERGVKQAQNLGVKIVKDEIAAFYASPVFDGNRGTAKRVLSLAGRDGQPLAGISDHRKGGLTTNKRSVQECECATKNEVIFLNSSKLYNKLHNEHMFSTRFPPKNVIFSQMSENFFDFSQKKWS